MLSIVLMKVIILFLKLLNFLQQQGMIIGSNSFAATLSLAGSRAGKSELVIFGLEITYFDVALLSGCCATSKQENQCFCGEMSVGQ